MTFLDYSDTFEFFINTCYLNCLFFQALLTKSCMIIQSKIKHEMKAMMGSLFDCVHNLMRKRAPYSNHFILADVDCYSILMQLNKSDTWI